MRAEGIDGDGERGDLAIDGRFFEEQRLAAAGVFHFAVGEFGDFEFGGDGLRDALSSPDCSSVIEKIAKGIERHAAKLTKQVSITRKFPKLEASGLGTESGKLGLTTGVSPIV